MIIKQKLGNVASFDVANRQIEVLCIEWYESNKRMMHQKTSEGREVIIKFLGEGQALADGDVLWHDEKSVIIVDIKPCDSIVIRPSSMQALAAVCYEIGNKHLPLFYDEGEILVPFEAPLFRLLEASSYAPQRAVRKLLHPLKTTVAPHGNNESRPSLFSRILQLTTTADV